MKNDLERARELLLTGGYTCVFCKGDTVLTDTRRGVAPLLSRYEAGERLCDFAVADKVVGLGAAHLYLLLLAKNIYAAVISAPALALLETNGVAVTFDECPPYIKNRAGTGRCPIETAVEGIREPTAALSAIRQTLSRLSKGT